MALDGVGCVRQGPHDGHLHPRWFAEGIDPADLKDAKALLDQRRTKDPLLELSATTINHGL